MDKTQQDFAMTEREMISDSLFSQKMIAETYNTYIDECSQEQLRHVLFTILSDEHDISAQLSEEMRARGWIKTKQAEQTEILQAKQCFTTE